MTKERAIENIRILGDNFALSMSILGKPINETSSLMNGLAAYHMLELKGMYEWLDESVNLIVGIAFEEAKQITLTPDSGN